MTRDQFIDAFAACEAAFHHHWTEAHDAPGYHKRAWQDLHNALLQTWRERATAIGIPKDRPLVRYP